MSLHSKASRVFGAVNTTRQKCLHSKVFETIEAAEEPALLTVEKAPRWLRRGKEKKIQRALGEKSLTFSTNIKNSTVPPCQLFPRGTLMLLVASEGLLCQVEVHLDEGLKSCENRPSICPAGTERVWPMGLSLAHIPAISGIFCNMRREAWPEIPN